jgi:hypothetical protein
MKHHNSKRIMWHAQELTDEQKCIGLRGFYQWQRLPWVQNDDDKMWTCELLQMKTGAHPLNLCEEGHQEATHCLYLLLDVFWPSAMSMTQFSGPAASKKLDMESPTEMRLLPDQRCETRGCKRRAKGHKCEFCNCANYCRLRCMAEDKGRHTRDKGNHFSECKAMRIAVQSWDQWQKFITRYATGKSTEDVLHKIQNYGDDWLRTAEEDLPPAVSSPSVAAGGSLAAQTYSMQTKLELKKWTNICLHMIDIFFGERRVQGKFEQWVDRVQAIKAYYSELLRCNTRKSVCAAFEQWATKPKRQRMVASLEAAAAEAMLASAAAEAKVADLRAAVQAAAQRERISDMQRTEEQKKMQALQTSLAEVHRQLTEQKKQSADEQQQRTEEQKQRAEEQKQRSEEQRLLAEVNVQRAATDKELQRTQKQLQRLQTRLETALAAERDAVSALTAASLASAASAATALAGPVSAARAKSVFDTQHCAVCFGDIVDAAIIPCGHTFCLQCAENVLSLPKQECHSCRGLATGVLSLFKD